MALMAMGRIVSSEIVASAAQLPGSGRRCSYERPTRGTVCGTIRSMCGADAFFLTINYQSRWESVCFPHHGPCVVAQEQESSRHSKEISALRSYRCTLEHLPNRHSQQSSRTCPKLVWSTFCEQEQLTTFPLSDSTVSSNWSEVTDDIEVVQNTIEVNNNNIILYNNSIIVFF